MINEEQARNYCCEDISLIENYANAVADTTQTWEIHHRLGIQGQFVNSRELLKKCGMYDNVPAWQLIFLTLSEHRSLHAKNRSEDWSAKQRAAKSGEKNPFFGKHHNEEHRIAMNKPETRAKIRAAMNRPETLAKISAARTGKTHSDETRQKISASHKGKPLSAEHRAKISAASKGRHLSAEARAKISAANKGKPRSEDERSKLSASNKAAWSRPEVRAKMYAAMNKPETRAKMSASIKAAWSRPEVRAKMHATMSSPEMRAKKSALSAGNRWWNNGTKNKFCKECPGDGWQRGRLRNKQS